MRLNLHGVFEVRLWTLLYQGLALKLKPGFKTLDDIGDLYIERSEIDYSTESSNPRDWPISLDRHLPVFVSKDLTMAGWNRWSNAMQDLVLDRPYPRASRVAWRSSKIASVEEMVHRQSTKQWSPSLYRDSDGLFFIHG